MKDCPVNVVASGTYVEVLSGPPVIYGVRVLPAASGASATPYRNAKVQYRTPEGELVTRVIPDDGVYNFNTNHLELSADPGAYLCQVLTGSADGIQLGAARVTAGASVVSEVNQRNQTSTQLLNMGFNDNTGLEIVAKTSGVRVTLTLCDDAGNPVPDPLSDNTYRDAHASYILGGAGQKLLAFRREEVGNFSPARYVWARVSELDLSLGVEQDTTWPSLTWADLPTPVRRGRIVWRCLGIDFNKYGGAPVSPATKFLVTMTATNDA